MLVELLVENFAVVERARVRFHTGLNLLTGETGSGKSLVVDALGLLVRNFSACTVPGGGDPLLRIDRLLSLQLRDDLLLRTACFADAWTNWLLTMVAGRITVCPVWTKLSASGSPTPENVAQNISTLPPLPDSNPNTPVSYGKEQFLYAVSFPGPLPLLQQCRTPQSCARAYGSATRPCSAPSAGRW